MKKEKIMLIVSLIIMSISSIISVSAVSYLYASNEVSYDNTNSGISATNVQGAINELYDTAQDYSSMNTRVSALEGSWNTNKNWLNIYSSSGSNAEAVLGFRDSTNGNTIRGTYHFGKSYNDGAGAMILESRSSSGTAGTGALELKGNPVKINGTQVAPYIVINTSGGASSATAIAAVRDTYSSLSPGSYVGYLSSGDISLLLILKANNNYGVIVKYSYSSGGGHMQTMALNAGTWEGWTTKY